MDTRDREAIDGLFDKLGEAERGAGPRDGEAERLIAERLQRQPGATYYMAQTIVMQDLALKNQAARIEELERAANAQPAASEGGGFFSGALRGGTPQPASPRTSIPGVGRSGPWGQAAPQPGAHSPMPAPMPAPEPYPQQAYPQQGFGGMGGRMGGMGGGGGFLAGAAQTAVGVAGGVMLGNALGSMFGGHGGLFGGNEAAPEVTENVTNNYYEAPQDDAREAPDTGTGDPGVDPGYQDASYDDPGTDDGFGGDDGGFENV